MFEKARRKMTFIKRIIGYNVRSDLKLICYNTLGRPILEYATQLCYHCKNKSYVGNEALQRHATKFILNEH